MVIKVDVEEMENSAGVSQMHENLTSYVLKLYASERAQKQLVSIFHSF
jgi:hypothetical protein